MKENNVPTDMSFETRGYISIANYSEINSLRPADVLKLVKKHNIETIKFSSQIYVLQSDMTRLLELETNFQKASKLKRQETRRLTLQNKNAATIEAAVAQAIAERQLSENGQTPPSPPAQ